MCLCGHIFLEDTCTNIKVTLTNQHSKFETVITHTCVVIWTSNVMCVFPKSVIQESDSWGAVVLLVSWRLFCTSLSQHGIFWCVQNTTSYYFSTTQHLVNGIQNITDVGFENSTMFGVLLPLQVWVMTVINLRCRFVSWLRCCWMYLPRKCAHRDILHIIWKHTE